jgi:AMP-binding enzyme
MAHPDDDLAILGSFLERSAASRPGHPAIRLDDFVLSYAELRGAAGQTSTLLAAAGVEPGDRVGIMLPNVPAFPIAFYGTAARKAYPLVKGYGEVSGNVRPSWASRSGSASASIWVIFPSVTVKAMTENSCPCGVTTAPAAPLTSAGAMNGYSLE